MSLPGIRLPLAAPGTGGVSYELLALRHTDGKIILCGNECDWLPLSRNGGGGEDSKEGLLAKINISRALVTPAFQLLHEECCVLTTVPPRAPCTPCFHLWEPFAISGYNRVCHSLDFAEGVPIF